MLQPPTSADPGDLLRIARSLIKSTNENEGSKQLQPGSKGVTFSSFISPVLIKDFWELLSWLECLCARNDRPYYSKYSTIDSEGSRQIRRWLHRCETVLKAFTAEFPYDRIKKLSGRLDERSSMDSVLRRLLAMDAKSVTSHILYCLVLIRKDQSVRRMERLLKT